MASYDAPGSLAVGAAVFAGRGDRAGQTRAKLGYKSAKHIYSLRVSNVLRAEKGFWEDQGYSWYGGI